MIKGISDIEHSLLYTIPLTLQSEISKCNTYVKITCKKQTKVHKTMIQVIDLT